MTFQEEKHGGFTIKVMSDKSGRWTFSICKGERQIACGTGSAKAVARSDALTRLSPEDKAQWDNS
jgi:hypothetical protein